MYICATPHLPIAKVNQLLHEMEVSPYTLDVCGCVDGGFRPPLLPAAPLLGHISGIAACVLNTCSCSRAASSRCRLQPRLSMRRS